MLIVCIDIGIVVVEGMATESNGAQHSMLVCGYICSPNIVQYSLVFCVMEDISTLVFA